MRTMLIALIVAAMPSLALAQRDTLAGSRLPRTVQREVANRWNAGVAVRSSERLEIQQGQEVHGDVAVEHGPVVIGGHVTGNVLAVNGDLVLERTARIDGDILVVGGDVQGRSDANVGGAIRIYRQPLEYHMEGERLVVEQTAAENGDDEGWWRRLERHRTGSWSDPLRIAQAGAYNRVEGLPVSLGPAIVARRPWGSFRLDAAAVVRTASTFDNEHNDVGHNVRAEVRYGHGAGIGAGGRLYNVVDAVETWQLSDAEVALASFLGHRDYRDYYQRHGGRVYVMFFASPELSVAAGLADEHWSSRDVRDPFTLFHNGEAWRPNPTMDEGRLHISDLKLQYDSRTDEFDPWAGWYVAADVERGTGVLTAMTAPTPAGGPLPTTYTRGFFDARRYNHLWPDAQLNLRVVLGGWMSGDALPLQRRLSVDGPGSLPGFDFRSARAAPDVGACTDPAVPGTPAECDRIALGQIEYRGDLHFSLTPDWDEWPHGSYRQNTNAQWVLFFDSGRGWRVGGSGGGMTYPAGALPPFSSFRNDLGLGFDLGFFGLYGAKSVSTPSEPMNFFVRLRHRF